MTTLYTKPSEKSKIRHSHAAVRRLAESEQNVEGMELDAEHARSRMTASFFDWVCEQRTEAELSVHGLRHCLDEYEPFALASIGDSELIERGDGDGFDALVPTVVWEYVSTDLQLKVATARLRLLDEYYFRAASSVGSEVLGLSPANSGAVRALWAEYMAAQDSEE